MPPRRRPPPQTGPQTPGALSKGKAPLELAYEPPNFESRASVPQAALKSRQRPPLPPSGGELVLMALDVMEDSPQEYQVWGVTAQGASTLLRLHSFRPYFYIAAPHRQAVTGEGGTHPIGWDAEQLKLLQGLLNRKLPSHNRIAAIEAVQRRPLLYYRPDSPDGATFLQLFLSPGRSARVAAKAVSALMGGALRSEGLVWLDSEVYEGEVAPLQRFQVDVPVCAGAWLLLPPGSWQAAEGPQRVSTADLEAHAPWHAVCCLTPDATQLADPAWSPFSTLTGTGTAESTAGAGGGGGGGGSGSSSGRQQGRAPSQAALQAAQAAKAGEIAGLRCLVLDVVCATSDGRDRSPVPAPPEGHSGGGDPVVAIACLLFTTASSSASPGGQHAQQAAHTQPARAPAAAIGGEADFEEAEEGGEEEGEMVVGAAAAVAAAPRPARTAPLAPGAAPSHPPGESLLFLLAPAAACHRREAAERSTMGPGTGGTGGASRVLLFASEGEMLLSWLETVRAADPDVIALFQVNDTLAVLQQRFQALQLGALKLSRLLPSIAAPLAIKQITQYSPQWVRSQARMSTTSNQQTFRAENVEGRLVVDVLRHCVTAQSLETFSLVDVVHTLLGQTLEVLRPGRLAALARLPGLPSASSSHSAHHHHQLGSTAEAEEADAMRLARYGLRRCEMVYCLMHRLATLPEMIESARATGLNMSQAMYSAQVQRVNSILLRAAHRQGFLVPGKREETDLTQTTFIMKPDEEGTQGLHRQPVAVLDFASLYPSIYRAHNMCYSTLVLREDRARFAADQLTETPTGVAFVKPGVRPGVLPGILSALVSARSMAREQLKTTTDPAARAVLDSRQKALKLTSNAVYGFTATKISPLQCPEAADSCLAIGAQSCRKAKDIVEAAGRDGRLGPHGAGARVLYGHTDSIFVLLPKAADAKQAIAAGRLASQVVTAQFPEPMKLAFERVFSPCLLLLANRYAGAAFEKEEDVETGGKLVVKGIRSMWRQTAPIVRTTLAGVLERIILRDDPGGAAEFAKDEIRRLLSGRVETSELVMSGGLWRVTGEQVERLAAGTAGPSDEDAKGPHNTLAVRLKERDPGRTFVLGQRLQYVLLAGHKKQDDAAEDPWTAAKAGLPPDYNLYWRNKLLNPLNEIFAAALPAGQQGAVMRELEHGEHTRVKVDMLAPSEPPAAALGPASPPPSGPRKRGGGTGSGGVGGGSGAAQSRMNQFFRQLPKCLSCRSNMAGYGMDNAPGLCQACASTEGAWGNTYLGVLSEHSEEEARHTAAFAACRDCHSGGCMGEVLCENGECSVAYVRLSTASRLRRLDGQLHRLDIF